MLAELEEFLTGMRTPEPQDRLLATILFTDIVGSTQRAGELGDRGWHELLEEHNARVRELIGRFGGHELDTAGDGFFASFEGPGVAVRCACAIVRSMRDLGLEIRAGLHTGECERMGEKLGGRGSSSPSTMLPRRGRSSLGLESTCAPAIARWFKSLDTRRLSYALAVAWPAARAKGAAKRPPCA